MKQDKNIQNASSETPQGIAENPFQPKPEISLHEVVPAFTNYEKLSDALRQDMRDASEILLSTRAWLDAFQRRADADEHVVLKNAISEIDKALAALDCTDHLQDSEVQS